VSGSLHAYGDVLTIKELAEWDGRSLKRVYQLVREGEFAFAQPRHSPGGRLVFSKAKLQQWADGQAVGTVPRARFVA
jgi:hypothetical protein